MAIQGKYTYKGIDIADSYIKMSSIHYETRDNSSEQEKIAAVYNSDGTLKTPAVMETVWTKDSRANYSAKIYKDKATRDGNPNEWITNVAGTFTMSVASSGKNPVKQAYDAMKATDDYKDYTDV